MGEAGSGVTYVTLKKKEAMATGKIRGFIWGNFFLSNLYAAPVTYNGVEFSSSEAALQAAKCPERAEEFQHLRPEEARRLGQTVKLRPDWKEIREDVVYEVCKAKFEQNPLLMQWLVDTGDAELVPGDSWGDITEESCLGKILMRIRTEVKE